MPPASISPVTARDPLMVHSVEKALRLLAVFGPGNPNASLAQLATLTGMDRSATQRFAHTLEVLGYLRKDRRTKRYALTVRNLDLANRYMRTEPLVDIARPYLLNLARSTQETVNLSILDGTDTVFVTRLLGRHVLNADVTLGSRHPAYCTSPGIAILSRMPLAEARAILARSDRKPLTASTVWRMEPLLEKLALSARRGYAAHREEIYLGDIAIGAAILDAGGRPIGAVNIAALRSRLSLEQLEQQFAPMLIETAQAVSRSCASLGPGG